eukprot:TRINITY_DN9890_c0_g1_i1.p1 TRINITY_DN9890_c0_g1~~TRINITY_DN9890_c0_g1_i1.p1  ORF type:complete len:585 (+),score=181.72 TRINITY_DN9890_c0_g1_i1:88-1755(+)
MAGMGDSCWAGLIPCCFGGRRGAARGEEDSEYLGSSLMGGATGAVKGAPTSTRRGALRRARDTLDGLRGKGKKHLPDLHQLPPWAKGKKRSACGATQTDIELPPVLLYQESSTSLAAERPQLIQQHSSHFQPELKQTVITTKAEAIAKLQDDVTMLRRRALRAELQELPHGEHKVRSDIEMEAGEKWKALTLAYQAPGTSDVDGGETADERINAQSTSACAAVPGMEENKKVVCVNGTQYSVLSLLGQGGQGKIYKVSAQGAFGAMKTERCRKGPHAKLTTEQLEWAIGLDHLNVLRTWGYTTHAMSEQDILVISVMEFGNETLTELIRQRTMTDSVKYDICIGVADGVTYINENGLVHGDLDHSNVLLVGGVPKVCDWGTLLKSGTTLGFAGKLETAAPEKVRGYAKASSKEPAPLIPASSAWDTFALGLLIHTVFAGTQPVMREQIVQLVSNMIRGKVDPSWVQSNPVAFHTSVQDNVANMLLVYATVPAKWAELHRPSNDVPKEIAEIMTRCCAVQPELRPTANAVVSLLRQAAENSPNSTAERGNTVPSGS